MSPMVQFDGQDVAALVEQPVQCAAALVDNAVEVPPFEGTTPLGQSSQG